MAMDSLKMIRLMVGDVATDLPFLDDETYEHLIAVNTYMEQAAVEALEMIINQIALSPQSVKTEEIQEVGPLVAALEVRLSDMRVRAKAMERTIRNRAGVPMIIKSDRSNWDDLNELFGRN